MDQVWAISVVLLAILGQTLSIMSGSKVTGNITAFTHTCDKGCTSEDYVLQRAHDHSASLNVITLGIRTPNSLQSFLSVYGESTTLNTRAWTREVRMYHV